MLVAVDDFRLGAAGILPMAQGTWRCRQLEEGHVLVLQRFPFNLPGSDTEFLLGLGDALAGAHKNIAYQLDHDRVTGIASRRAGDAERLRGVLRTYATWTARLVT